MRILSQMDTTTTTTDPEGEVSGRATYSPEDNKLRLYVGRVPRSDYERLRAEGWTSTPKQASDFVATWTPDRADTAREFAGIIEDEDEGLADRSADRAERFGGYRDKRLTEATTDADRHDRGPGAFGFQSERRAARAAARHDRIATRAGDAWSKADYWQHRTAGVISHALHKLSPAVRMGRIKEIETDIRRLEKSHAEYSALYASWTACAAMEDKTARDARANRLAYHEHGDYVHPRSGRKSYLFAFCFVQGEESREADPLDGSELCALWLAKHRAPATQDGPWLSHFKLRLAYENQMLEAQGGRAAFVEMEVGGWIGGKQIRKVNKSNETGRVVSVTLKVPGGRYGRTTEGFHLDTFNVERLPESVYTAPSPEDKAALAAEIAAEKAAAPKAAPCPLINPSDEEAERLQAIWNERAAAQHAAAQIAGRVYQAFEPSKVLRITQGVYTANSKGSFARLETRNVSADAQLHDRFSGMYSREEHDRRGKIGPAVCQIRRGPAEGDRYYSPARVIILTDKARKAFPVEVWPVVVEVAAAPAMTTTATAAAAVVVAAVQLAFL